MTGLLDFAPSDERAGFRLHRLEIYNWGTFHDRVWALEPGSDNALLTGDIGSGKSTLVDAVTTLLVPSHRIAYNKAAGAESRERTLRSYVLGYYKSERGEGGLSARPVALRDPGSFSAILAHFYNEGYGQHVTLAQVFWMKDLEGQPARLFLVADRKLSIAEDLSGFGSDVAQLRKRLKQSGVEVSDSFPPYGAAFRRRFGIENEQALELFHQTVSMKSVGNLTDFVRNHMLEAFDVAERISALLRHFDDLHRAHEAVLKARRQIELLRPIVQDGAHHRELLEGVAELRACRDALEPWFAGIKAELLQRRRSDLEQKRSKLDEELASVREELDRKQVERDGLKASIAANGGDRLERIDADLRQLQRQKADRQERADKYQLQADAAGLPRADGLDAFVRNRAAIADGIEEVEGKLNDAENAAVELSVRIRELAASRGELDQELRSLRERRSSIPSKMLQLRAALAGALEVDDSALPFAGELLQVRADSKDWEGAIERLLHNFALSVLVPESLYAEAARWVDRTNLGGRLVYFRVRPHRDAGSKGLSEASLVHKLELRANDAVTFDWVERELQRRFDYACCDSLDQFRRVQQGITRAGQIKHSGDRHEKDDRRRLDDRSQYVLGWSNEEKIAELERILAGVEREVQKAADAFAANQQLKSALTKRRDALRALEHYDSFTDLDWAATAVEIDRLERERRQLEASSNLLKTLKTQLEALELGLKQAEELQQKRLKEHSVTEERLRQVGEQLQECLAAFGAVPQEFRERLFPRLEAFRAEALGEERLTVEGCADAEKRLRKWLQERIDADDQKLKRLGEKLVSAMQAYRNLYPVETQEVDARVEALGEYASMLSALESDDLPRFEAKFKELLNENTIREIANFQSHLAKERELIKERIADINRSLQNIDYNKGRYIRLEAAVTPDAEVRDFQQQLRACTEGSLTGSEGAEYGEAKFLEVKRIIERFRGREGTTELDRRWTAKVTDVRNWFVFSASERWRESDEEHEHYTDSGGKSGGQKEKLAYTVLAASLAYQFGLEWGEKRSRSFRFVVIDEAFGRGSDESARYGLQLFKELNLQLLIVTPLQKIHIIEPFVSAVGFVHNEDGRISKLRNLTIEAYRAERAARTA